MRVVSCHVTRSAYQCNSGCSPNIFLSQQCSRSSLSVRGNTMALTRSRLRSKHDHKLWGMVLLTSLSLFWTVFGSFCYHARACFFGQLDGGSLVVCYQYQAVVSEQVNIMCGSIPCVLSPTPRALTLCAKTALDRLRQVGCKHFKPHC